MMSEKRRAYLKAYLKAYRKEYMAKNGDRVRAQRREYCRLNRDLRNSYSRKWHRTNKTLPRVRYKHTKGRGKTRLLLSDITLDEYICLLNLPCFYCNKSLLSETGVGLDRIDNSRGYCKDNVLPCCGGCNKLRGDRLTVEEAKVAIEAVLKYRESLRKDHLT